jgi:hypothetical protein
MSPRRVTTINKLARLPLANDGIPVDQRRMIFGLPFIRAVPIRVVGCPHHPWLLGRQPWGQTSLNPLRKHPDTRAMLSNRSLDSILEGLKQGLGERDLARVFAWHSCLERCDLTSLSLH